MTVILLAGLGFGDEGKGTCVDHLALTTGAKTVVRYNGGAQAAHNVITDAGVHHTFAQFGAGTFAGARTHLSRHMLVNPITLETEAKALRGLGFDCYKLLTVEREALVTTVYHVAMNRIREMLRGDNRHGSCGFGIGETRADALALPAELVLRVGDLKDREVLRKKLSFLREYKLNECAALGRGLRDQLGSQREFRDEFVVFDQDRLTFYIDLYAELGANLQIVDRDYLPKILAEDETVIFEGAQGVLLDETYGFHPHTTWTDTTFRNAYDLLQGFNGGVRKVGVLRGYMTRHGAGPFPTELKDDVPLAAQIQTDLHNKWGQFQEHFRLGHFDAVLARYALAVIGGVDELMITNIDKMGPHPRLCTHYEVAAGDIFDLPIASEPSLVNQERMGQDLTTMTPVYEIHTSRYDLVAHIAEELDTFVSRVSVGPKREDKFTMRYLRDSHAY